VSCGAEAPGAKVFCLARFAAFPARCGEKGNLATSRHALLSVQLAAQVVAASWRGSEQLVKQLAGRGCNFVLGIDARCAFAWERDRAGADARAGRVAVREPGFWRVGTELALDGYAF